MNTYKFLLYGCVAVLSMFFTACMFCGCQQAEVGPTEEKISEPVFFPPLPDKPRLQFLTSFSSLEDFGGENTAKPGKFEEFIVGKAEEKKAELIIRPYGTALYDGKLYICDTARGVLVIDVKNRKHSYLTKDSRLINPVCISIDDGVKYITDPKAPGVFVFDRNDKLIAIFGKDIDIVPLSVVVRGQRCYVTDQKSKQVIVLDKTTGEEITRIGKQIPDGMGLQGNEEAQFRLIGDLALDKEGNLFVTDRVTAQISKFDAKGLFVRTYGEMGDAIANFIRPKGVAVDREDRIWVVDAATQVCKIYNTEGLLLLYFGMAGNSPGKMNLPATVTLDYDNVELFQEYAAKGAQLEFLAIITNQYGPHKVSVFGFGSFPLQEKFIEETIKRSLVPDSDQETKEGTLPEARKEE